MHRIALSHPCAQPLLKIGIVALAVGIFALDAVTPVEVSVSLAYVLVVLLASRVFDRTGLLLVGLACAVLAILTLAISPGEAWSAWPLLDRALGVFAISMSILLVVQNQSATDSIREQANLLNLTHDSIFVRSPKNIITYWNRGSENLYGWTREEAVGKIFDDLVRTTFPVPAEQVMQTLRQTGHWEGTLTRTRRGGTTVTVAARWNVQPDARGQFSGILETNNDITERQRALDRLQQAQDDLARITRVTTMGQLAASIAHEVNQPLTGVVTNGYTMLHWLDAQNIDKARVSAERVIRDGERASGVIQRIRALLTKTEPETKNLDVNSAIGEVLALLQTDLRARQIVLRTELAPERPSMVGDPVQLQQVLLNLVMNGADAMLDVTGRARILVIGSGIDPNGDGLVFVRDHGVGLDQDTATKIFDPFFTTKAKGMGMGLAICRSIVEAHGGRLWASPAEPHGALFQFTIPSKADADL